ncbi:MAG: DUF1571 domain-containing protein [Burkholderiales bacterium]|nr:DUF1571 domain-containing protein [Burkholderiales bacterium]MDE2077029.1 DUF1571 domain-containing protein [Burkholderiales bacterium]MDE2432976.1 DUF1571 domain-containing protein [Burkholderiales bacterium]
MYPNLSRRRFHVLALTAAALGIGFDEPARAQAQARPLAFASADPDAQAGELAQWFKTEKLVGLPDDLLIWFFKNIAPATYVSFLKLSARIYREAEFWVRRQERLPQGWTDQPFVNYIKYRQQPRQVYVSWMDGGPDAGAEVIYDETVDKDQVYGHAGGILGIQPFWVSLNSALAKTSSNHSLRDMGPQYLADRFAADTDRLLHAGGDGRPSKVEILPEVGGRRLVAVTWIRPSGRPTYYAKKIRLAFDLRKVYVRTFEAWDDDGQIRERIVVDNALARKLADSEFRPSNPEYKF